MKSNRQVLINLVLTVAILFNISPVPALLAAPPEQDFRTVSPADSLIDRALTQTNGSSGEQSVNQPGSLPDPLSIARVQSTYQAGGVATVTYTVRNNWSAADFPQLAAGLNVTDTVAALDGFDPLDDPNTMHNVVVSDVLIGASLDDASHWPNIDGDELLFNLGDIAPQSSIAFTLALDLPATASDFIELDTGAIAHGTFQGRGVTATAPPVRLAPDGYAAWLVSTPDAYVEELEMLFQSAEIGDDPNALFDFVQNLNYEAYDGSLRGTRGTLWSEAGNSVDQSSLLIAMLRAAGYPARYRHGTLPIPDAQALIESMFEAPFAIRGAIPAGTDTSDPTNDAGLLALTQNHWWVEAYLPGAGWIELDPTVSTASFGSTPATPLLDSTDQIAELPDNIRHKVSFELDVERYSAFPLGGLNLQQSNVLSVTIPASQTAGEPVNIGFAVESNVLNGLIYASTEHTYTPYLAYGDGTDTIFGATIHDLLTSFPLATQYTTGVWLEVVSTAPDGSQDTYRRTIKDLVGADLREFGGSSTLPPRDDSPLLTTSDLIQVQPMAISRYPAAETDRILHSLVQQTPELVGAFHAFEELPSATVDEIYTFVDEQFPKLFDAQFTQLELLGSMFQYGSTGPERPLDAETMLVKSYPDRPKLILMSQVANADGDLKTSFELLNIKEKAIAFPGQNAGAVRSANFLRTTSEKAMEYDILSLILPGDEVRSAIETVRMAGEQGIPTRFIFAENLGELAGLAIPEKTKAHITSYANQGYLVWVPEQMVPMPYGDDIGFMVVSPEGDASYVDGDGYMAAAALMYALINQEVIILALVQGTGLAFTAGFFGYIFTFLAEALIVVLNLPPLGPGDLPSALAGGSSGKGLFIGLILAAKAAIPLPIGACLSSPNPPACQGGVMAGYLFVVTAIVAGVLGGGIDPSLTDFWVSDIRPEPPESNAQGQLTSVATIASSSIAVDVSAEHHYGQSRHFTADWRSSWQLSMGLESLQTSSADIQHQGVPVGSGTLTATDGFANVSGSDLDWSVAYSDAYATYAGAGTGLAIGQTGAYTASVNSAVPYSAEIDASSFNVNGTTVFTSPLDATINTASSISGTVNAPAPLFTDTITYAIADANLMVSSIDSGTINSGGDLPSVNSLAIAGYTGDVTIVDIGTATDQVMLSGSADFFTFNATPSSTVMNVNQPIVLAIDVLANFTDSYTVTVNAPTGWANSIDVSGTPTITPTATAMPGTAAALVTLQSHTYPELFTSDVVDLTLNSAHAVDVAIEVDSIMTVPMGPVLNPAPGFPLTFNHVADGQAEVEGAAFNVTVHNESTAQHTFDISVTGLPVGWPLWGDSGSSDTTSITLEAGATQVLGLYVIPPQSSLLAGGTSYPFTVTVTDQSNGAVNDSAADIFTMPDVVFPYLTADPILQTVIPGDPALVDLFLQNVGNVAASYPITIVTRAEHFSTATIDPTVVTTDDSFDTTTLAPGEIHSTTVGITTTNALPGDVYLVFSNSSSGEYEPTVVTAIQFASPLSGAILESGACLASPLDVASDAVVSAFVAVESSCTLANCPSQPRVNLLGAIDNYTASVAAAGYNVPLDDVLSARNAFEAASNATEVIDSLPALSDAFAIANDAACIAGAYQPVASWTPSFDAILLSDTQNYTLTVTNAGTMTTTYAITATLPEGDQSTMQTLDPGASAELLYTTTPGALGLYAIEAEVVADVPELVQTSASAGLNVVEKFLQITAVTPTPDFVETGTSSTVIDINTTNYAGLAIPATAHVEALAPGGGVTAMFDTPITVGSSYGSYTLGTFDTSGWAEGVYTITVDLQDSMGMTIPDGSNYGYLAVGVGLNATHSVAPALVSPGTVTVTTVITTELTQPLTGGLNTPVPYTWEPTGLRALPAGYVEDMVGENGEIVTRTGPAYPAEPAEEIIFGRNDTDATQQPTEADSGGTDDAGSDDTFVDPMQQRRSTLAAVGEITRTENISFTLTGGTSLVPSTLASGGNFTRLDTIGETATYTVTGSWAGLGFATGTSSGIAEIYVDGSLFDTVDLYERVTTSRAFYYDFGVSATRTISVTATDTKNPFANGDRVNIDFIDTYDGTPMPDGVFEEDDPRVWLGSGWSSRSSAIASDGTYLRTTSAAAWFPFSGDSISYQTYAASNGGSVRIAIDGVYKTTLDLHSLDAVTRTISFDGLGSGPHVMHIESYRGTYETIDQFSQPGSGPFFDPTPTTEVIRVEEDSADILYNGVPFAKSDDTNGSWDMVSDSSFSNGYFVRSSRAGDVASYTFTGDWIGVGFAGGNGGGIADVYIDGVLQESVDTYRFETEAIGRYYTVITGTHTISVSVTGTNHPNATFSRVNLDYFDTWTGNALPAGQYNQDNDRLFTSTDWTRQLNGDFRDGAYWYNGSTVWFPFTGESVKYLAAARTNGDEVRAYVDGNLVGNLDLYASSTQTRTYSFDGFAAGELHMLQISYYRGTATVDGFDDPGTAPFFDGTPSTGVIRYEEDSPALLYNGDPFIQAPTSWDSIPDVTASTGHYMRSSTANDSVSMTFTGDWIGVGLVGGQSAGMMEVFIDSVSQGTYDNYRWDTTAFSHYFDGLGAGSHTIEVVALGTQNPFASNDRINIDYFDVWDGSTMATGTFTATLGSEVAPIVSNNWSQRTSGAFTHLISANNGSVWLPFTGDSVSFDAVAYAAGGSMNVLIDGQFITRLDLYNPTNETRTLSFDGLGAEPHVLHLQQYRGNASIAAFTTPGSAPFYVTPPAPAGVIHHEEDSPALRYNGAPFTSTVDTWLESGWNEASGGTVMRSEVLSNTVSLDFYGSWVAVGMMTWSGGGLAELFIDGVSQGIIDSYSAESDVLTLIYDTLTLDNHTLEIVVLADQNPLSSNDRIYLDYIDVWDGSEEPDGWYELDRADLNDNVSFTTNWKIAEDSNARDGKYWYDGENAWFRFTGQAFTIRAFTRSNVNAAVEVYVDGVSQGVFSTYYRFSNSPLPLHFDGFADGPHLVRVNNVSVNGQTRADIDAFEADPTTLDAGIPMVEWEEIATTGPIVNTSAAGDIDEDGVVEIVATDSSGNLIIYRGDGADATGPQAVAGTPIEFMVDLGGEPDTVALAELDGQPGAEIAVGFPQGFAVYHLDSGNWVQQWFTDTVRSTWRAPSIGNIDADPEPEIVTTGNNCICILQADGTGLIELNKSTNPALPNFSSPLPPNLADLTGDGRLDILTGDGTALYAFDTATNPPTLAWTQDYTDTIDGRGTPAIADMDGHLPSGDDGPEIAFVSQEHIYLVEGDSGDVIWRYATGGGAPGGTSIADLTGDGIPEIVATAQIDGGKVFVLDAAGNLVWSQPAVDFSSANSASVLDLDGDGIWEIAWNGDTTGFIIWRGSDGAILYNEPLINSSTRMDFPIIADVDGDDSAEIITGDGEGLFVIGWDELWASSRPIWNEYNYHITNINDDLSVPVNELDSWDSHNTYRTQTPLQTILPIYDVVVTHTVPLIGVEVLTSTASLPFDTDNNPYSWQYEQAYYQTTRSNDFDVVLADMQPGETRMVAESTIVEYTLPSGSNRLTLPSLYVNAAHIIAIEPDSLTVSPGGKVTYTVTLTNVNDSAETFDLTVVGLQEGWLVGWLDSVIVPANSVIQVSMVVMPDNNATVGTLPFIVQATVNGATDMDSAELVIVDTFELAITPATQTALAGTPTVYTLTVTNLLATPQTIDLVGTFNGAIEVNASASLPASGMVTLPVTVTGNTAGAALFSVEGLNSSTNATDTVLAALETVGSRALAIDIVPDTVVGGAVSPLVYTVTVSNLGSYAETAILSATLTGGWSAEYLVNGYPVTSVDLNPGVFNSAELTMLVSALNGTLEGNYPIVAEATSSFALIVSATDVATATINALGVGIEFADPGRATNLAPGDTGNFTVEVTNHGSTADTFDLSVAGFFALSGVTFTPSSVSLAQGAAQQVQVTTAPAPHALPQAYELTIVATSQADAQVQDVAQETVIFSADEGVDVEWLVDTKTIPEVAPVTFILTVTNTGSIAATYDLTTVFGSLAGSLGSSMIDIPPGSSISWAVELIPPSNGTFAFSALADNTNVFDSADAQLIVEEPTAIGLVAFEAFVQSNGSVLLQWETAVEIENAGFNVYRSATPVYDPNIAQQVNPEFIVSQAELGQGASYELVDVDVARGIWFYFLEDIEMNGVSTIHGPVSADTTEPTSVGLSVLQGGQPIVSITALTLLTAVLFVLIAIRRRKPEF